MGELFTPSLADEISCIEREIALRERVYPRWVSDRRMTQQKADREIATMKAVLSRLRGLQQKESN